VEILELGTDTGADNGDTPAAADAPEPDLLAEPPAKRDDDAKPRGPYKKHKLTYKKGGLRKQMNNIGTWRDRNR
jgi:hypothetical protein